MPPHYPKPLTKPTAVELRCLSYGTQAPPSTVVTDVCAACGAAFQDWRPGWDAHLVVFGHNPTRNDPERTPR